MKTEWREFLENKGAELEDGRVGTFGNPERELRIANVAEILADLSHTGLIGVYGEDAAEFLQGQFTNDVGQVTDKHSQLSAYCSPKGRVLASFRVFKRGNTYYIHLPRSQVEPILKRLRMFVLRSRVTLEDASDALVRIGFSGPDAAKELEGYVGQVPGEVNEVIEHDGLTILSLPGPQPRFEIHGEVDAMSKLWTMLDVRAAPVGAGCWELLDILAGIPTIYPETSDLFVPQMANLELLQAVSFQKGCYTGQEVVARMHYLGKPKRRMFRAHIEDDSCPEPGTNLYAADNSSDQSVGRIVNALPSPQDGCDALAVVDMAARARSEIRAGSPEGALLSFTEPPYSLETDGQARAD